MPSAELGVASADNVTDLDAMFTVEQRLSSERPLDQGACRQLSSMLVKA